MSSRDYLRGFPGPDEYRAWAIRAADAGDVPCATRPWAWHGNHRCDCEGSGPFGERAPGDSAWPWWLAVPVAALRRRLR